MTLLSSFVHNKLYPRRKYENSFSIPFTNPSTPSKSARGRKTNVFSAFSLFFPHSSRKKKQPFFFSPIFFYFPSSFHPFCLYPLPWFSFFLLRLCLLPAPFPLWFRTTKNRLVDTGPLTCLFAHFLTPLIHFLALPCLLC